MNKKIASSFLLLALTVADAHASELVVVADFGGTPLQAVFDQGAEGSQLANAPVQPTSQFPIVTSKLAPARFQSWQKALPVDQPFFLVGDDALSKAWLRRNAQQLTKAGALGFYIHGDRSGFEALAALAASLSLAPINGDSFASLGLTAYPCLVTGQGVWQ